VQYSTVVSLLYSVDYLFRQGGGASDSEIFCRHVGNASRIVVFLSFTFVHRFFFINIYFLAYFAVFFTSS